MTRIRLVAAFRPRFLFRGAAVFGGMVALAGCAPISPGMPGGSMPSAIASLAPTQGSATAGEVRYTLQGTRLAVTARVSGLKPNQVHGFHVHEKGDCSSPDAMSAGGHFNPSGAPHGAAPAAHHAGDMPSLTADAQGNAQASFRIDGNLGGDAASSFVGKAVIVHAMPDDYATQPTGNSGARLACGVIRRR
ncbi:MAG: superoxide dismutase family protein [Burkholderiaceae bacterium]